MRVSNGEWARQARIAQRRADERRAVEAERARRLLPAHGWLEWVGLGVAVMAVIVVILAALWLAGIVAYDPAFAGR